MGELLLIPLGLAFVAGVIAAFRNPAYAMIAVLAMFPAEQVVQAYSYVVTTRFSWLINALVAVIVMTGLLSSFFSGRRPTQGLLNPVTMLVWLYYGWGMLSTVWTPSPDAAAFFYRENWPYFGLHLVAAPLLIRRVEDVADLVRPLMWVAAALIVLVFVNPKTGFYRGRLSLDLGYVPGIGELRSNVLALSDFGSMMALMALLFRSDTTRASDKLLRWGVLAGGLLLALLAGGRGQLLFTFLCAMFFVPLLLNRGLMMTMTVGVVSGVLLLGFAYLGSSLLLSAEAQSRWSAEALAAGLDDRIATNFALLQAYMNSPQSWLQGLGAASFNAVSTVRADVNLVYYYPHNITVEALTEYGLIGFMMFLGILALSWGNSRRLLDMAPGSSWFRSAVVIIMALGAFSFLTSQKQGATLAVPQCFMFFILLGKLRATEGAAAALAATDEQSSWSGDTEAAHTYASDGV